MIIIQVGYPFQEKNKWVASNTKSYNLYLPLFTFGDYSLL